MLFKKYKIQPNGRNRYGSYNSVQNMSGNITYATYAGNESTHNNGDNTSSQGEAQDPQQPQKTYIMFLTSNQGNFEGAEIAVSPQTAKTQLVSYVNSDPEVAYVGDFSGNTGISGISSGMSVSITNNYSSAVSIEITMTSALTNPVGTLLIPCYMPKNGEEPGSDLGAWATLMNEDALNAQIFEWNWSVHLEASSVFVLDLTNETAGVNCDADGNVLTGVTLPSTTARLYYGDTQMTGVTYAMSIPAAYNATGITFNTSTGELTCTNELAFDGKQMAITISATYGGYTREKIFNLFKNFPGEDGEPAVTRWLTPSTNAVIFNPVSSSFTPYVVSCTMYKQVGSNEPVSATDAEVYYRFNSSSGWSLYTLGSAITLNYDLITSNTQNLMFAIKSSGSPWYLYETETIPILRNGQQGEQGPQGIAGPSVRGPVDWYSGITANRRFSNGEGLLDSDKSFIDIILKDGDYYKCTTSFDFVMGSTWDSVKDNFTLADEAYNFVATNLLLAENAKINFLTNNSLQLMDSGGTISAGAAGGSGNDIAFWAGSGSPSNAPFRVDHNGNLSASTGQFGFMKIFGGSTIFGSGIEGSFERTAGDWEGTTLDVKMSPEAIWFTSKNDSGDTTQEVFMGATTVAKDYANGLIYVDPSASVNISTAITNSGQTTLISQFGADRITAINSNGKIIAPQFVVDNNATAYNVQEMSPLFTPGLYNLPVVFVIPDSGYTECYIQNYIGKCTNGDNAGYWVFRGTGGYPTYWSYQGKKCYYQNNVSSGISTGVDWRTYPYPFIAGTVSGVPDTLIGHIGFARTNAAAWSPDYTCVFLPMQTTAASKQNHILYLEIG